MLGAGSGAVAGVTRVTGVAVGVPAVPQIWARLRFITAVEALPVPVVFTAATVNV